MVQRKAKRRVIMIAIGAAVFAGYSAVTLFANDDKATKLEELNKMPAVRSVGIRLLAPTGHAVAPGRPMQQLVPPPRMADAVVSAESGKVSVRLTSENRDVQAATFPGSPTAVPGPMAAPSQPMAAPSQPIAATSLPSTGAINILKLPVSVQEDAPKETGAVRMTMGDSGVSGPEGSVYSDIAKQAVALPIPRTRNPELIKPKGFQISEAVTLASAPEIDLEATDPTTASMDDELSNEMVSLDPPPVDTKMASGRLLNQDKPVAPSASSVALPAVSIAQADSELEPTTEQIGLMVPGMGKTVARTGANFDMRWAKSATVATVEMESQSATALEIPGLVRSVAVENEDVCRVLHTDRTISIVGNKQGTSLVQIWTQEIKDVPQLLRVNVSKPWQKPNAKTGDLEEVKQVLAEAFPNANLQLIKQADGTLEVRGTTENEETARRVLEIVRKLCLVPVKDRVTVSR